MSVGERIRDRFLVRGVDRDTALEKAASRILVVKAEPLFDLAPRALAGRDADAVHDMRVASRRVRAAMELFEPLYRRGEYRDRYRLVRSVTRALGRLRDADVLIEGLETIAGKAKDQDERMALAYLVALRRGEREVALAVMRRRIGRLDLAVVRKRFKRFAEGPRPSARKQGRLDDLARHAVLDRLTSAYGFLPAAATPENAEAQHAMRIACKGLRYAIETTAPCFGESFTRIHGVVRRMQDALGTLHDIDVLTDVAREVAGTPGPARVGVTRKGFDRVLADLAAERAERFARFKKLADRWPETRLRRLVEQALSGDGPPSGKPGASPASGGAGRSGSRSGSTTRPASSASSGSSGRSGPSARSSSSTGSVGTGSSRRSGARDT